MLDRWRRLLGTPESCMRKEMPFGARSGDSHDDVIRACHSVLARQVQMSPDTRASTAAPSRTTAGAATLDSTRTACGLLRRLGDRLERPVPAPVVRTGTSTLSGALVAVATAVVNGRTLAVSPPVLVHPVAHGPERRPANFSLWSNLGGDDYRGHSSVAGAPGSGGVDDIMNVRAVQFEIVVDCA